MCLDIHVSHVRPHDMSTWIRQLRNHAETPRVVKWSLLLVGSLAVVTLALGSGGGSCIDSTEPVASACASQGSPFLLVAGVAGVLLSGALLWRSCRSQ